MKNILKKCGRLQRYTAIPVKGVKTITAAAVLLTIWAGFSPGYEAKGREKENIKIMGDSGRIEAVVRDASGNPVPGSRLYVYLNNNADFRGPADQVSDMAGDNGETGINLRPGKYFIVARKRVNEGDIGPLKEGDFSGRFDNNPVELKAKGLMKIEIIVEKIEGKMLLSPLSPGSSISVEGTIRDMEGNPVKNAYAMLYITSGINGRPDYMSRPSDDMGRFKVYVAGTGRFFIIGRIRYGSPPKFGELYGEYNKDGIEIKNNDKIKDIEIILKPFDKELDLTNKQK